MKRFILLASAVLLLTAPAQAMIIKMDIDEMAQKATHIVRGQVVSLHSAWTPERTTILTAVTVRVDENWKGSFQKNSTVVFSVVGGVVGTTGVMSEHAPKFFADEKVLLFLDTDEQGQLRVAQDEQGKFTVAEPYVVNQLHNPIELNRFKDEVFSAIPREEQR